MSFANKSVFWTTESGIIETYDAGVAMPYKMGSFNPTDANYANMTLTVVFIVLTGAALLTAFTIMKTFEK